MTYRLSPWPATISGSPNVDTDLEHRLISFICQQQVPNGERVEFTARGGVVAVRGELPTARAKWLCIECSRRVAGVLQIVDQLRVAPATAKRAAVDEDSIVCRMHVDCIRKTYVGDDRTPRPADIIEAAPRAAANRIARRQAAA